MKSEELNALLNRARTPEVREESLETFTRKVLAELRRKEAPDLHRDGFSWRFAVPLGLAACVMVGLLLLRPQRAEKSPASAEAMDILADNKLVGEMLEMFPNRIRAIVEEDGRLNVLLFDRDTDAASTPLYVRLCDGKHCASFVTFSGQEISVGDNAITTLCDGRGDIILEARHFVWSSIGGAGAGPFKSIEAKALGRAAL